MSLTANAEALASRLEQSPDRIAICPIPSVELAAEEGLTGTAWTSYRAATYDSIGAAITELREHGWALNVRTLGKVDGIGPGAERVVVVEAEMSPNATESEH